MTTTFGTFHVGFPLTFHVIFFSFKNVSWHNLTCDESRISLWKKRMKPQYEHLGLNVPRPPSQTPVHLKQLYDGTTKIHYAPHIDTLARLCSTTHRINAELVRAQRGPMNYCAFAGTFSNSPTPVDCLRRAR